MRNTLKSIIISAGLAALIACDVPNRDGDTPEIRPIVGDQGVANPGTTGWRIDPDGDLNAFFECLEENQITLVSAHRGGPAPGFPENAIETFEATMAATPALIEMDVATSSDGVLYLMHDDTLDRTTTGSGTANGLPYTDIQRLSLEDNDGRATPFAPPRFDAVLNFIKGRTIAQIDFKRTTRFEDVIDEIRRAGVEDRVILISYSLAQARRLHRLAPEMMISLSIDNEDEFSETVNAGIPKDRLLVFTGLDAPKPRLNSILNNQDVEVIFGTLGGRRSIDRQIAATGDPSAYVDIARTGVDIIATDRPREAHMALQSAGNASQQDICGVSRA